jgi:hypothetical protein
VSWQTFVVSPVQSLAWPAGVVAVVIVLRKPIGAILGQGVRRVKAGQLRWSSTSSRPRYVRSWLAARS